MSIESEIHERANNQCELCTNTDNLSVYAVPPVTTQKVESSILVCGTCADQIENPENVNPNHWRCLNDSMWSEVNAVKVVAWRMLSRLKGEGWPQDLLDMMYLEDDVKKWAEATGEGDEDHVKVVHKDSNGAILSHGDTVVIIKDLNVKGSSLVAKRGTAVRNISLVHDNAEQIEGKVEGQQIVILTQFVKKS
ncbi:MAG: PhnA domain-containing protein [Vicingus serpentipes]|nr:PhnA domain-containing protein [Vicingus serpentipes]